MEVNKVLLEQTPERRATELEPAGTVNRTAWTKRDDSSCRGEPATELELRAILQQEGKVLQHDNKDPEDNEDMQQRRKERTETDAKAGVTRHLSRQLNGAAKRAGDPADAKVGSTQHSPSKRSSNSHGQLFRFQRSATCRYEKRLLTSVPRSVSTKDRRRDQRKGATKKNEPYSPSDASLESLSEDEVDVLSKHRMELRNRRRRAGETLQNVHSDIR